MANYYQPSWQKNKTLNFTKITNCECDGTKATTQESIIDCSFNNCDGTKAIIPESVADSFINYLSTVGCQLKIWSFVNCPENANSDNYQKFHKGPVARSMYLESINAGEVYKIILSFKNKSTRDTKIEALKLLMRRIVFTSTIALIINN